MLKKMSVVLLAMIAVVALFAFFSHGDMGAGDIIISASEDFKAVNTATGSGEDDIHIVKEGESLYLISQRYGLTLRELMDINGLKSDLIYPGQKLITAFAGDENGTDKKIQVIINKGQQKLSLYEGDKEIKIYRAEFGEAGMGDKEIQGDRKTPEGTFYITEKSVLTPTDEYLGSRWMRLSYPAIEDADRGLKDGIIDSETHDSIVRAIENRETPPQRTALGGGIGIHGGHVPEFGDNWTWGCIGLTNEDAEEIFDYVSVGTPVLILR